jgi:O-antigen/teichoic acid export membrane protein
MLDGLGRFVFKSAVRIGVLALRVPLTLAALRTDDRLIALGCVITGCNLLEHLILATGVQWALPTLRFHPASVNRQTVREVAGYSRDAFVAMIAGRLAFHTDAFVLAPAMGLAAVTVFSLPARLVEWSKSLLRSATSTLTAAFSTLEAREDVAGLQTTFLGASRWAWYAALPVQAGLIILGQAFLSLWVGPHYADVCMPVAWVLATTLSLTIAQSVASRVLYGTGRLRGFARATVAEGLTNLALSLVLVRPLGVIGVALGTAVPHALFCVFVIGLVCHSLDIGAGSYLRCVARPLVLSTVPIVAWLSLAWWAGGSWGQFFAAGLAGLAPYAVLVALAEGHRARSKLIRRFGRWPTGRLPLRAAG